MKILSRNAIIEHQKFILITDTDFNKTWYGTIPYTELEEEGKMKRELNGIQMCITTEGPMEALEERRKDILITAYKKKNNPTLEELCDYIMSL